MNINEFIATLHNEKNIKTIIKNSYIPVEDKKNIALEVLENCITEENGYVQIDRWKRDIYFDIAILREYTNLNLSYDFESMLEEYDVLYKNDIFALVFEYVEEDYACAKKILEYEEQNILDQNSIEAQVVKVSHTMINILDTAKDKLNNFDMNSLMPEDTDINQLVEMLKQLK